MSVSRSARIGSSKVAAAGNRWANDDSVTSTEQSRRMSAEPTSDTTKSGLVYRGPMADTGSSHPLRLVPPSITPSLERTRLTRSLHRRFSYRVTVVSGAAGFGKTEALRQAGIEEALNDSSQMLYLRCELADADAARLLSDLGRLVGSAPITKAEDFLASLNQTTSLVLDQCDCLLEHSGGAELIQHVIEYAPQHVHIVLVCRSRPPVRLSRLDAAGGVLRIGPSDLLLDASETTRLAEVVGLSESRMARNHGWVGLAALQARGGSADAFLSEEVLSSLSVGTRQAVKAISQFGWADAQLLDDFTEHEWCASELLAVPFIYEDELEVDGSTASVRGWRAGRFWSRSGKPHPTAVSAVVGQMRARGRYGTAFEISRYTNLIDGDRELLRDALVHGYLEIPSATVSRWWQDLSPSLRAAPAGAMLAGLREKFAAPFSSESASHFRRAADGFRSLGDGEAEVAALAELGAIRYVTDDVGSLVEIAARVEELAASGVAEAGPYAAAGRALMGVLSANPGVVFAELRTLRAGRVTPEFEELADFMETKARNLAGFDATELADGLDARRLPAAGLRDAELAARWHAGDLAFLGNQSSWAASTSHDADEFIVEIYRAAVASIAGRYDQSDQSLGQLAPHVENNPERNTVAAALVKIGRDLSLDPARDLTAELDELLDTFPAEDAALRPYSTSRGWLMRLRPDLVSNFASLGSGPLLEQDIRLAEILRQLDRSDLSGIRNVAWPQDGQLLVSQLLPGACLFLVAAHAVGRPEALETGQRLAEFASSEIGVQLEYLQAHENPTVAESAGEFRTLISIPPKPVSICLFGPSVFERDGRVEQNADWRRGNVRALFVYLALEGQASRDRIMTALWPDSDTGSAGRSLRSTLNLLHTVLEPDRGRGRPFFIQADSRSIRLDQSARLDVDLWRFLQLEADAAHHVAEGVPSLAVEPLIDAVKCYAGDLASDLSFSWLDPIRERERERFATMGQQLADLLIHMDRFDEGLAVAEQVIGLEPWSEKAHRSIIHAHLACGRRAEAVRAARTCQRAMSEIGGISEPATKQLVRSLMSAATG